MTSPNLQYWLMDAVDKNTATGEIKITNKQHTGKYI